MAFRLKSGKYNILWPISILKYCLPLISSTFYGQIFALLISPFKCPYGRLYFAAGISCKLDTWFYISFPIAIIAIIIQFILSYITLSMYYQADFLFEGNDIIKKRTSISDIFFLFNKMILILIFGFDKEIESEHWALIIISCITSGINAYCTLFLQSYENIIIKKLNNFYCLFLFWGFLCLFIGKIFKSWEFNGAFYLFIIGIILITIYCLFYAKTFIEFIHLDYNEMNTSQKCMDYIKSYLKFIKNKDISRDSSMMMTTFIEKMEHGCKNENCILKKYLISFSKGFDSKYLLLQFAQNLYKIALNKFPRDITLRIHYIIFLLTQINQKKNAKKELFSIVPDYISLDTSFKIYRCKKYIEEYNLFANKEQFEIENNDILLSIKYKNNSIEFKKLLSKCAYLYYDFWSSLLCSHLQGFEDFKKLSDIGAELSELIENIENIFTKLREIKNNDLIIIKLYESFCKNILNDKEKYEKYYNISMDLIIDNNEENKDIDFSNFDLKILNKNDEYKYIIISADGDNKGKIINISSNACVTFGYNKQEIIGKSMNILIPELYHKLHNKLFNEMTEKTKNDFHESLSKKLEYNPDFLELKVHARNKSKYLIIIDFIVFFIQTEESELAYILKFSNKNIYNNDLNEDNKNNENLNCCVLTDNNFIIQTFSPNCVELLGLNTNIINSNYDITSFIKGFNDELQTMITTKREFFEFDISETNSDDDSFKEVNNNNKLNDKSFEQILKYKKKLLRTKYITRPRKIRWRFKNQKIDIQSDINKSQISLFIPKMSKIKNDIEGIENNKYKKFIMEVKEANISGRHIGYYFYFKKIKLINETNLKNINRNKLMSPSPLHKSNIKRYSSKLINFDEESVKSSRIYNDEDANSLLSNNDEKMINESKKKTSIVTFELEYKYLNNLKKNESAKMLSFFNDEIENINDKYIPNCNFNFFLDLESMSYKPSKNLDSNKDLYNTLRRESIEKFNIFYKTIKKEKEEKENTSSISSGTENSSLENEDNSKDSSSYISSSQSNSFENEKKIFKRRTNQRKAGLIEKSLLSHQNVNINNNIGKFNSSHKLTLYFEREYYNVKINRIKFMKYDFEKEMVVDSNIEEKKSQMEIIIENFKLRKKINISEDSNYSNFHFEKYIKDSKPKNYKNYKKSEKSLNRKIITKETSENKRLFNKEKEFEKEISEALARQDQQKAIIFFYQASFLFLIIAFLMCILEIYFIINQYLEFKENIKLVIMATNLKYFTNFGIYFIRENTLYTIDNNITNGKYTIPHSATEIYKFIISNNIKNIFSDCNSILENIFGTSLVFSNNTKYILTEAPFNIEILYNNTNIKIVASSLYVSMVQIFSGFCNLLSKSDYISIDNPNLFNFLHNSFNNIGSAFNIQIDLFISELTLREKHLMIKIIIYSIIYLILHIFVYLIICKSYFSIVKKKASYISVFYGIGLSLIKLSIKKCELFINKMNQNEDNEKIRDYEDETSSLISASNFNSIFTENNFKKKNSNKNNKRIKPIKKKIKLGEDKKSKKFKIFYTSTVTISFLYLVLIFFSFFRLTTKFISSGTYIYHMQNYHNNIIELFNGYREYLFDENHFILGLPIFEYLIKKEKTIYELNTQDINYLTVLSQQIKGLYQNFLILQENGFCKSYVTYFNSERECQNFIGGENGIISLGFHLLINSFIEEIRNARNFMKLLLDEHILVGNLSKFIDIKSNDKTYNLDKNNTLIFRMKVFNIEQIHFRLNIIFHNIILQYINRERNITVFTIDHALTNVHIIYVIFIIIYLCIFLIMFFFYWIPMIQKRNNEIYKTKNMLTIIPVQILASQPNIKELLNISTKND